MKALVTGASSGIGKAIAKELNKEGYDLVLVAKDEKKLEKARQEINEKAEIISLDLSEPKNCKILHEKVKNIDLLVNNAGFGTFGEFSQTDLDKELALINTNITALHILTKLYLQDMRQKENEDNCTAGQILNVASIAGYLPGPLMATYYSSKSYVVRLTQSIRQELKKQKSKIKVSLLNPGPVSTNFNNVAGVKFNLNSQTPEQVARYTVRALKKKKFMITPSIKIKLAIFFSKITPIDILSKITYKMQERKR